MVLRKQGVWCAFCVVLGVWVIKLRIAVCDDERHILEIIKRKLYDYSNSHNWESVVDTFDSGNKLIESDTKYDIIILDYQMNEIDGLETAKLLRQGHNSQACIIFLTSFPEVAIPAYDVDTYRFVLKNNIDIGLTKALDDFRNMQTYDIDLCIKVDREFVSVNSKDIVFIEVVNKICYIHLNTGKVIETKTTLSSLYGKLPKTHFFKIHKAYVVNFSYIARRKENDIYLKSYNLSIPISRNYLTAFKRKYYNFLNDLVR